jgi:hypothetical protein
MQKRYLVFAAVCLLFSFSACSTSGAEGDQSNPPGASMLESTSEADSSGAMDEISEPALDENPAGERLPAGVEPLPEPDPIHLALTL